MKITQAYPRLLHPLLCTNLGSTMPHKRWGQGARSVAVVNWWLDTKDDGHCYCGIELNGKRGISIVCSHLLNYIFLYPLCLNTPSQWRIWGNPCYSYHFSLMCVAGSKQLINTTSLECELPVQLNPAQARFFECRLRALPPNLAEQPYWSKWKKGI